MQTDKRRGRSEARELIIFFCAVLLQDDLRGQWILNPQFQIHVQETRTLSFIEVGQTDLRAKVQERTCTRALANTHPSIPTSFARTHAHTYARTHARTRKDMHLDSHQCRAARTLCAHVHTHTHMRARTNNKARTLKIVEAV